MKPYLFQKKIIDSNPKKTMLSLGCGTGKTFISLSLAEGNTLVVTTKTIRDDKVFERQLEKMIHKITFLKVISKEDLRKDFKSLPKFNTVILDEHDLICGLTPNTRWRNKFEIPKASQVYEAIQDYLKRNQPERLYLCSATSIRNPMVVLAAAWLLGKEWDFYNWRREFYVKLPMPGRMQVYSIKKDSETKDKLAKIVRSLGPTGRLTDFKELGDVPPQTHVIKHIPLLPEQIKAIKELSMMYPDPMVLLGKTHQIEQGILIGNEFEDTKYFSTGKMEVMASLIGEYEKVIIFAKYTAQIKFIEDVFKKMDIPVYTLTGETKNRGTVILDAELSNRCVVICQSQISSGFELPSFRCTIFASESYSYRDYDQAIGRNLRINFMAPNLYVYLVSGRIDKAIREAIESKKDFSERVYLNL